MGDMYAVWLMRRLGWMQARTAEVPGAAEAEAGGERGPRAPAGGRARAPEAGEVRAGDAQRAAREDGRHAPGRAAAAGVGRARRGHAAERAHPIPHERVMDRVSQTLIVRSYGGAHHETLYIFLCCMACCVKLPFCNMTHSARHCIGLILLQRAAYT